MEGRKDILREKGAGRREAEGKRKRGRGRRGIRGGMEWIEEGIGKEEKERSEERRNRGGK